MKLALTLGVVALASASFAQFGDNFESETGSAGGTLLTNGFGGGGQNGWYNPVSGSVDGFVYTYAGNGLGFATNPSGGSQFVALNVLTVNATNRAQHDVSFAAGGVWKMSYDFSARFAGTPPATDNLGSVSLQPSGASNYFQSIFQWTNPADHNHGANADAFNANLGVVDANGTSLISVFSSPGPAFLDLPLNNWFRMTITWDFASNKLLETSIQNLTTAGGVSTVNLSGNGWYLTGGANNVLAQATPTAIRLFGSGAAGDQIAYDNFSVSPVPEPASIAILSMGALAMLRRRRKV